MRYNLINFCEIDKYASDSYCHIHSIDKKKNLGNILDVNIEALPTNIDLITHGSPCVSFSKAGLKLGGDRNSGTPSSLMWNSVEIIRHCRPNFVIWENVSDVINKKHKHNFDEYISVLDGIGYVSLYKIMNGRFYGIPQNRDRIFVVSIRNDIFVDFIFPLEVELDKTFRDFLEETVDEKWYLDEKQIDRINSTKYAMAHRRIQEKDWCDTLCARDWKDPKCVRVGDRVRKLTPLEYWRLMGFSDEDFYIAASLGISNTQLYKQAGNSIVLPIALGILQRLKFEYPNYFKEDLKYVSLFSGIGAFEMALKLL